VVLEEHLAGVTGNAAAVLHGELLHLELVYRRQHGEIPRLADYVSRFPDGELLLLVFAEAGLGETRPAHPGCPCPDRVPAAEGCAGSPVPFRHFQAQVPAREPPESPTAAFQVVLQSGNRLGNYELLEELGRGGMGVVFRARHAMLRKEVALKVLSPHLTRFPEAVARFHQEIEAAGRLEHPNLLRASDAGAADGVHYLVTELLAGENLARLTERVGPWPIAEACAATRQAALGLAHAHAAGLVHRDVKPGNLMLTADGVIKVLDLGLARLQDKPEDLRLTDGGTGMGTADYCSPEQFLDSRTADARSDLYSLGCTLFHLLAGTPPFGKHTHPSPTAKRLAHLNEPAPDVRSRRPEVPEPLAAVVAGLLAKQPEQRPASAAQVAAALEPFAAGANLLRLVQVPGAAPVPPQSEGAPCFTRDGLDVVDEKATRPEVKPKTRTSPGPKNKAVSRRRWRAGAALVLFCGLGAGLLLWGGWLPGLRLATTPGQSEPPGLSIRTFRVTHVVVRDGGKSLRRRGLFGEKSYGAWLGDGVQVEVEFSEPAYAYLLVFNPNPQADKREEVQPESERDRPPAPVRRLEFPGGFGRYELSDGPGLEVFAVVASRQPLPAYSEWARQRGEVGWQRTASVKDVVWTAEGGGLRQRIAPEDPRGQVVAPAEAGVLEGLQRKLESAPGVEAVSLVAFTVEPRP
jgi:serine/threonine protein kinase